MLFNFLVLGLYIWMMNKKTLLSTWVSHSVFLKYFLFFNIFLISKIIKYTVNYSIKMVGGFIISNKERNDENLIGLLALLDIKMYLENHKRNHMNWAHSILFLILGIIIIINFTFWGWFIVGYGILLIIEHTYRYNCYQKVYRDVTDYLAEIEHNREIPNDFDQYVENIIEEISSIWVEKLKR